MELVRYDTVDNSKIEYKSPEKRGQSYYSDISYQGKPLMIICPKMVSKISGEDVSNKGTPSLELETSGQDFSFYDCLVKLDDHNLASTYKFSKEWFKKELPMDVLENMYRRITKPFKKGDIPEIELKIPVVKQKIQCKG